MDRENHQKGSEPVPTSLSDNVSMDTSTDAISYQWLGEGVPDPNDPTRCVYEQIQLGSPGATDTFVVRVGDCVLLLTEPHQPDWPCRVERLWEDPGGDIMFAARWFWLQSELAGLNYPWKGDFTKGQLLETLKPMEVVFSHKSECDDTPISSILKPCKVTFTDAVPPSTSQVNHFYCRYLLTLHTDSVSVAQYSEAADATKKDSAPRQCSSQPSNSTSATHKNTHKVYENDEDGNASLSSDSESELEDTEAMQQVVAEGEGSILRGDILVGKKHQAPIPPYNPDQPIRNRGALLVWKKQAMKDETLFAFLNQVAKFHNEFLETNGLVQEEPYSPLPVGPTEHWMRELDGKPLTGSFLSTAGMLASSAETISVPNSNEISRVPKGKSNLLKECDADVLLEILHAHNYDTAAALTTAQENLERLSTGWTRTEKEMYDDGFRRHQTALRHIAKSIATKSVKQVIDYHFRFKIPDQFRKYQEKKREQAVRMVECIEKRRYHDFAIGNTNHATAKRQKKGHWSDTPVLDVAQTLELRRQQAKQLLLDVRAKLGADCMSEVAGKIRQLHESYDPNTKDALFRLLRGEPSLQKKFLGFLPK
jgi:hypothetical protein